MSQPISEAARIMGERVRDQRTRLALSQEDVAHLAGMNVSNYGKIERGLGNPSFHTLVRIAAVLGVDPALLVSKLDAATLPEKVRAFSAADYVRERAERERGTG